MCLQCLYILWIMFIYVSLFNFISGILITVICDYMWLYLFIYFINIEYISVYIDYCYLIICLLKVNFLVHFQLWHLHQLLSRSVQAPFPPSKTHSWRRSTWRWSWRKRCSTTMTKTCRCYPAWIGRLRWMRKFPLVLKVSTIYVIVFHIFHSYTW